MKRTSFLNRLKKDGKLELVEPSEEIKQSYLEKSDSNLVSAKILLENNKLEEAVALTYYSMYHSLTALLFKTGIKCENHSGSILLLKKLFEIDNSDIEYAKKERVDKQYYVDFNITKDQVNGAIREAGIFNGKIRDFISRMTSQDVNKFRDKFVELVK